MLGPCCPQPLLLGSPTLGIVAVSGGQGLGPAATHPRLTPPWLLAHCVCSLRTRSPVVAGLLATGKPLHGGAARAPRSTALSLWCGACTGCCVVGPWLFPSSVHHSVTLRHAWLHQRYVGTHTAMPLCHSSTMSVYCVLRTQYYCLHCADRSLRLSYCACAQCPGPAWLTEDWDSVSGHICPGSVRTTGCTQALPVVPALCPTDASVASVPLGSATGGCPPDVTARWMHSCIPCM